METGVTQCDQHGDTFCSGKGLSLSYGKCREHAVIRLHPALSSFTVSLGCRELPSVSSSSSDWGRVGHFPWPPKYHLSSTSESTTHDASKMTPDSLLNVWNIIRVFTSEILRACNMPICIVNLWDQTLLCNIFQTWSLTFFPPRNITRLLFCRKIG